MRNQTIIVSVVAGAIISGMLAYLYLTDSGAHARASLTKKAKSIIRDQVSETVAKKTGVHKKNIKKAVKHIG